MTADIEQFHKQQYLNLETFRKDGSGVKTPLWFVRQDDALYMRTLATSWKVKRIRRQSAVRIVPSDAQGAPKGEWVAATAELLPAAENAWVSAAFIKKYGLLKRLIDLRSRWRGYNESSFVVIVARLA
ncbi:MAG: PPOX class F420-dependent oxidoreductase [Anaerolineales bacterium]|nr:PPOX class F420-dependent oxidoreductase [Anaerolineales bacterium]MCB8950880.1 PPOX class F420-dependent oxidoreductase [Ardenticatenales bacterium]